MNVPIHLASSSALLAIHANNNKSSTIAFNGVISGAGSVNTGSNDIRSVVFNANNTFSGTMTVGRGAVQFNGQNSGLGDVSVTGATAGPVLGGTGSIALQSGSSFGIGGALQADRLAFVAPGQSVYSWTEVNGQRWYESTIGTFSAITDSTVGFEFQRNSRLQIEVGTSGQSDLLAITGNLTFTTTTGDDGTPNLGLNLWSDIGAFDGSNYTIMTWTGTRDGWFNRIFLDGEVVTGNIVDGWDLGNGYQLLVNSNSAVLKIPEPAYAALLFVPAIGLALLLSRRHQLVGR